MHLALTPSRRPWLKLLALAGGVAMLHLVLWQGVADSFAADAQAGTPTVVLVRTLTPTPRPATPEPAPVAVAKPTKPAAPPPRRVRQAPVQPEPQAEPAPVATTPEPVLVAAALAATTSAEITPVAALAKEELPQYRTQIPPAMTLHYAMYRGALRGAGELTWNPSAQGYTARLDGRLAGFNILTWVSQGGFDAAGLAPLRYTDKRRGKSELAANFQRGAGKITFSGPSTEYPLLPGAQDRMSWMIQIAAIASADPKRLATGARLAMYVVGARGDAEVWAFKVQGPEEVATRDSPVQAIKLLREPRKPHDTRVEVWLAPSLHYLPVRARLTNEGSALELLMQSAQPAS